MKKLFLLFVVVAFSSLAFAGSVTINFEQLSEFTQVTNQYSAQGVSFTNALQLVAPDYDNIDYPPHSGVGVVTNDPGSVLTMTFAAGSSPFSLTGWFSSPSGMTATAYDSHGDVLATFTGSTVSASCDPNTGICVSGTNAAFSLNGGTFISYVTFTDGIGADGLTLDDLNFTTVPEPATTMVMGSGLLAFGCLLRRKLSVSRKLSR